MAETIEVKLELEKTTMNTYRYKEMTPEKQAPILKTLYIQKWIFGEIAPRSISVTISY